MPSAAPLLLNLSVLWAKERNRESDHHNLRLRRAQDVHTAFARGRLDKLRANNGASVKSRQGLNGRGKRHDDNVFRSERINRPITQCYPSDIPVTTQCEYSENTVQCDRGGRSGGDDALTFSIENLIQMTVPGKAGTRNRQAMSFARGPRFNCGLQPLNREELKRYARQWYEAAEPYIGSKNFDETFGDILQGYMSATKPLDAPSRKLVNNA